MIKTAQAQSTLTSNSNTFTLIIIIVLSYSNYDHCCQKRKKIHEISTLEENLNPPFQWCHSFILLFLFNKGREDRDKCAGVRYKGAI